MKKGLYFLAVIIGVLLIGLVSAGLFDSIKRTITGYAQQQDTNVSVTVLGIDPVTIAVDNSTVGSPTPIENNPSYVSIYATVCDPNGVNDIDDSSVAVTYSKSGETSRSNNSCSLVSDIWAVRKFFL